MPPRQRDDPSESRPPDGLFQPWHLRSRSAIHAYLNTLEQDIRGWLLAMFVDDKLNLVGVDPVGWGAIADVRVNLGAIVRRAHSYRASGFFLVHDHPEGVPEPALGDIVATNELRQASAELGVPLVEHCIVFRDTVRTVGGLDERGNTLPWPSKFIR